MAKIIPNVIVATEYKIDPDVAESKVPKPLKTSKDKREGMEYNNKQALLEKSQVVADTVNQEVAELPVIDEVKTEDVTDPVNPLESVVSEPVVMPEEVSVEPEPVVVQRPINIEPVVVEPVIPEIPVPITTEPISDEVAIEDNFEIPLAPVTPIEAERPTPVAQTSQPVSNESVEIPALKSTLVGNQLNTVADWQKALEEAEPNFGSTKILSVTLGELEIRQYRLDEIEGEISQNQSDIEILTRSINQLTDEARVIHSILINFPPQSLAERPNPNSGEFLASVNLLLSDIRYNFEFGIPEVLDRCKVLIEKLKDERNIKAARITELKAEAQEILTEMRHIITEAKQDYIIMKKADDEKIKTQKIYAKYSMPDDNLSEFNRSDNNDALEYLKRQEAKMTNIVDDGQYGQRRMDNFRSLSDAGAFGTSPISSDYNEYITRSSGRAA